MNNKVGVIVALIIGIVSILSMDVSAAFPSHPPFETEVVILDKMTLNPINHSKRIKDFYLPEETYTTVVINNTGNYSVHYEIDTWDPSTSSGVRIKKGFVLPGKQEKFVNLILNSAYWFKVKAEGPGLFGTGLFRRGCKATATIYVRMEKGKRLKTPKHPTPNTYLH